jgi:nitrate/TMAO reductase-like tetraheme cytochrome c subunit
MKKTAMNDDIANFMASLPSQLIMVRCASCDRDYSIDEVRNETTHPSARHVVRFDCPQGHHCEARRIIYR